MTDISDHFHEVHQNLSEAFYAEECEIANTVDSAADDVFVLLVNGDDPAVRVKVTYWKIGVEVDDTGTLIARYPERGKTGIVIHLDTQELWLIH